MSWTNVILWLIAVVILLLLPVGKSDRHSPDNWRVGAAFCVGVISLASSPIISLYLSGLWGLKPSVASLLAFAWVGFAISLPLSLITARTLGPDTYVTYLAYLERSGRVSIRTVLTIWAVGSIILLAYGTALFW